MREKKKRVIVGAVLLVILIGLIFLVNYLQKVSKYQNTVKNTVIEDIHAEDVADGVYEGEYDVDFIYAKVEVTVEDGRIDNIELLEHRNERGKNAEGIIPRIIEAQKVDVEAVSGATNSSTVIKKAVEKALVQGKSR
ncbi:MAG: FMN-binding protein [Lachnospiraceae bacterium]|nr:FMN-binding protein [Lachnospiraceae bacterium]